MTSFFLRSLIVVAGIGFSAMTTAAATQYTSLDAEASSLTFSYRQMSVKMDGRFGQMNARELSFDPANPENATVIIDVSLKTIDAGYADANAELEKDEWLALAKHPIATFTSKEVTAVGENRYEVTGDLSIKGITKEVVAPFTFEEEGDAAVFDGRFVFQRGDFNVGEGEWEDVSIVANDIQITFRVVARP